MRKTVLAVVAALSVVVAWGQKAPGTFTVYPRLGVNMSTMSEDVIYVGTEGFTGSKMSPRYKGGLTAGVEAQYQIVSPLAVSAGALYSMEGTRYSDYESADEGTYYAMLNARQDLHYLTVPLLAVLTVGDTGFSLKAGVQLGWLLRAKSQNDNETGLVNKEGVHTRDDEASGTFSSTSTSAFRSTDFGIPLGVAYEHASGVSLDLRYYIGLSKRYRLLDDRIQGRSVVLTLGYAFDL